MENFDKEMAYIMAKHKAEKLKRFYVHGIIFLAVNIILIVVKISRNLNNGETFNEAFFEWGTFSTVTVWGIVLAIHAYSVFGNAFILGAKWEENKIKQYIKEEENNDNIY